MRNLVTALLLALLVTPASRGLAEEPDLHVSAKKWWTYLKGEWTTTWSSGSVSHDRHSLVSGGQTLLSEIETEDGNRTTELGGWDPKTKSIRYYGFGASKNYWVGNAAHSPMTGTIRGVTYKGVAVEGKITWEIVDKNMAKATFVGKDAEGKDFNMTAVKKRKTKKSSGKAAKKAVAHSPWKFLTGKWHQAASNGVKSKVTWKKIGDGRDAIVGRWKNEDGTRYTEVVGWHPATQELVSTAYGTNGAYWRFRASNVTATQFQGKMVERRSNGETAVGVLTVTRINDELFKSRFVGTSGTNEKITIESTFEYDD